MHGVLVCLLPLALSQPAGDATEWSSFLGPNGSCQIDSAALPDTLDPEKTLRWRAEIAGGYSSPIVVGDVLFLTSAAGRSS